ncbi:MAG: hypothetical protein Q9218_004217 [Villophora microphyllina]
MRLLDGDLVTPNKEDFDYTPTGDPPRSPVAQRHVAHRPGKSIILPNGMRLPFGPSAPFKHTPRLPKALRGSIKSNAMGISIDEREGDRSQPVVMAPDGHSPTQTTRRRTQITIPAVVMSKQWFFNRGNTQSDPRFKDPLLEALRRNKVADESKAISIKNKGIAHPNNNKEPDTPVILPGRPRREKAVLASSWRAPAYKERPKTRERAKRWELDQAEREALPREMVVNFHVSDRVYGSPHFMCSKSRLLNVRQATIYPRRKGIFEAQ